MNQDKEVEIKNTNNLKILDFKTVKDTNKKNKLKVMFRYTVKNENGKIVIGYFNALSKLDCYTYLVDKGYTVYNIESGPLITFLHGEPTLFKNKMATKDLVFYLTQLSTYVKSGIPLVEAVKMLANQNKNRRYRSTFESLIYELTMGESFSSALEKQGEFFPQLLINMVKSAEMMGDLEGALDEMSKYYENIEKTKRDMISAVSYPSVVLVFSIAIISFILTYVIPKFVDVYETSGVEMNNLTALVLKLSNWLSLNFYTLFVCLLLIVVLFRFVYKKVRIFRKYVQKIVMKIPIIGKIVIYNEIALFSKTFSSLSKAEVPLTDSLNVLCKITNNETYKELLTETINNLIKGNKMSETFKDNKYIPEVCYYMIVTGEETSELPTMLEKVSTFYEELRTTLLNTIKNFIEPVMIALLAFIVGGIILAVVIPMFGLYSGLS